MTNYIERMLGALSMGEVCRETIESKFHHAKSVMAPKEIDAVLSLSDLEGLYRRPPLFTSRYQIITKGTVEKEPAAHPQGGIDPDYLAKQFRAGSSLRVTSVQDLVPAVNRLCQDMAQECKCMVSANIYATPPGNAGFDPHYDDHDVIVLQCHGSKLWSIHENYENKEILPLAGIKFEKGKHTPGPATHEICLDAGDALYIPRGVMHSARTADGEQSVHLTLSLNWITWNELIFDMLAEAAMENVEFRKGVLPSLMRDSSRDKGVLCDDAMREKVADLLRSALKTISASSSFESLRSNYKTHYFNPSVHSLFAAD